MKKIHFLKMFFLVFSLSGYNLAVAEISCPGAVASAAFFANMSAGEINNNRIKAENGDADAQYKLGAYYLTQDELFTARKYFKLAAAQGNRNAKCMAEEILSISNILKFKAGEFFRQITK